MKYLRYASLTVASHLSCVGFPIKTEAGFMKLLERALQFGEDAGDYVLWRPSEGIELWLPMDDQDDCIGCHPHFVGNTRVDANVTQLRKEEDGTYLSMTVNGSELNAFLVNCPEDFQPGAVKLQLALFADQCASEHAGITEGEGSILSGEVTFAEAVENTETENRFNHVVLRTEFGVLDVVAEAETALPLVDSRLHVRGWLSARRV
jgi:hypothetical protein